MNTGKRDAGKQLALDKTKKIYLMRKNGASWRIIANEVFWNERTAQKRFKRITQEQREMWDDEVKISD